MKLQRAVYLRNYCHVVSSFCFHFVEERVNEHSEVCRREKPIYMDMHCIHVDTRTPRTHLNRMKRNVYGHLMAKSTVSLKCTA